MLIYIYKTLLARLPLKKIVDMNICMNCINNFKDESAHTDDELHFITSHGDSIRHCFVKHCDSHEIPNIFVP